MRIINGSCSGPEPLLLGSIKPGYCVRLVSPVHQKHCERDVFMRLDVRSGYWPEQLKTGNRGRCVAVANLRSGALAYINYDREVIAVDAEVCVSEC